MNVLFVTNGHGEAAIAGRIAAALRALAPATTEHFPLVGTGTSDARFPPVGPRRAMPSGGLVAMGNVRAFAADLGAGWLGLFADQRRFLRAARARYTAVAAVGDAYVCAMARAAGLPLAFVGTAKSVYVAPYGPLERRILAGARRIFVRDAATAAALRTAGVPAEAPGNVIVDLLENDAPFAWPGDGPRLALLPGSREPAVADAERLAAVAVAVAERVPATVAALSIAPTLGRPRFATLLARYPQLAAWEGPIGGLLAGATLALGQAGTANEAAAAAGVPVVALGDPSGWYRMRQERLLGAAMLVLPDAGAAGPIAALLRDPERRAAMAAAGRERMGPAGGAARIAAALAELAAG